MRSMKRWWGLGLAFLLFAAVAAPVGGAPQGATPEGSVSGNPAAKLQMTPATESCLQCHAVNQPNLVATWKKGRHAAEGIGCYECHQAKQGEPDAMVDHYGYTVSTIVSPKDCSRCHPSQAESFLKSHHARAATLLRESDVKEYKSENGDVQFGMVVQGMASFLNGCESCHGTKVEINPDRRQPTPKTWPNFGIGRLNPDGSAGTCSACHQRHEFRMDAVRMAGTCGRCHLGEDHPQWEIWKESKHGAAFHDTNAHLDLTARPLLLGRHPIGVPTCSTCHVGATTSEDAVQTHDPGERLSWRTGPEVSERTKDWQEKRLRMQTVCGNCHSPTVMKNHFAQFDKAVALFNHKFAIPAQTVLNKLREAGKLDASLFNEPLERIWLFLWHHEGRRARMGVAMMGPDYVQWQGFYEVALGFYFHFIPEAERLQPGITDEIMARPEHSWYKQTSGSKEEVSAAIKKNLQFWLETSPDPEPRK